MDIDAVISSLTRAEKAALVAGTDFMYTNPIPRLGIPSVRMSDGPHGLRVQNEGGDNGVTGSEAATCFPPAVTTAASWNPENAYKIGAAIGREARHYGIDVVLGPAVNIKRNPLGGRCFEYFSEDPYLAGRMGAAEAKGIQSEGVGTSVKHFALNNSENYRQMGDSIADMRAIREIYLKPFEMIVKEAEPETVMCAYNKVLGSYCSENGWLLSEVLRSEWGFGGTVMTDWGATHDRLAMLRAGLDLEMPGDTRICRKWILDALESGELDEAVLDAAVGRVLALVDKHSEKRRLEADFAEHHALAGRVAADSAVLLKNGGMLPLDGEAEYFVCGEMFERMRYQGSGSSMINPTRLSTPKAAFDARGIKYSYSQGYRESETEINEALIAKALEASAGCESVLVFAGLTDYVETEGADRENMRLPQNQLALIDAMISAGKRITVVLYLGSPVELPFADGVDAILNMYLPGQAGGEATAALLFGELSPSGRLAESWPFEYADVPFGDSFGKTHNEVYKESVFVGYRYYATVGRGARYPFGYGLSYTSFEYENIALEQSEEGVSVLCDVKNVGSRDGAEVVQLYVGAPEGNIFRPIRELKGFKKVYLRAGQTERVCITVRSEELKYFNAALGGFALEGGEYRFELCSDSERVRLSASAHLSGEDAPPPYSERVLGVYRGAGLDGVTDEVFEEMAGVRIPALPPRRPLTLDSRFSDMRSTFIGKILHSAVLSMARSDMKKARKMPEGAERDNKILGALFLERVLNSSSVIGMSMNAGERCPYNMAEMLVHLANGRVISGLRCLARGIKVPPLPKDESPGK